MHEGVAELIAFIGFQVGVEIEDLVAVHHISSLFIGAIWIYHWVTSLLRPEIPEVVIESEKEKVEKALLYPELGIRPVVLVNFVFGHFFILGAIETW